VWHADARQFWSGKLLNNFYAKLGYYFWPKQIRATNNIKKSGDWTSLGRLIIMINIPFVFGLLKRRPE